jgi:hypothetical protein
MCGSSLTTTASSEWLPYDGSQDFQNLQVSIFANLKHIQEAVSSQSVLANEFDGRFQGRKFHVTNKF